MKEHMFAKRAPVEMETMPNLKKVVPLAVSRRHLYSAYAMGVYLRFPHSAEPNVLTSSSCLPMVGGRVSSVANEGEEAIDLAPGISLQNARTMVMGYEDKERKVYTTGACSEVTDLKFWDGYVNLKKIEAKVTSESNGKEGDLAVPADLSVELEVGEGSASGPQRIEIGMNPEFDASYLDLEGLETEPGAVRVLSSKGAIKERFCDDIPWRKEWRARFMPGSPIVRFEDYDINSRPPEIYGYIYYSLVRDIAIGHGLEHVVPVGHNILEIPSPDMRQVMRLYLGEIMRSDRACKLFGVRVEIYGDPNIDRPPPGTEGPGLEIDWNQPRIIVEAGTVGSNGMGSKPGGGGGYTGP